MKIGLMLERDGGADEIVCKHFIKLLLPDAEFVVARCTNKKELLLNCHDYAETLFLDGCEHILIIWDLEPGWKDDRGNPQESCLRRDRLCILKALKRVRRKLKLPKTKLQNFHLICIYRELEAWLIADRDALISAVKDIRKLKSHKIKKYKEAKCEELDAKGLLRDAFGVGKRYTNESVRIIKKILHYAEIEIIEKYSPTFARFVQKVKGLKK